MSSSASRPTSSGSAGAEGPADSGLVRTRKSGTGAENPLSGTGAPVSSWSVAGAAPPGRSAASSTGSPRSISRAATTMGVPTTTGSRRRSLPRVAQKARPEANPAAGFRPARARASKACAQSCSDAAGLGARAAIGSPATQTRVSPLSSITRRPVPERSFSACWASDSAWRNRSSAEGASSCSVGRRTNRQSIERSSGDQTPSSSSARRSMSGERSFSWPGPASPEGGRGAGSEGGPSWASSSRSSFTRAGARPTRASSCRRVAVAIDTSPAGAARAAAKAARVARPPNSRLYRPDQPPTLAAQIGPRARPTCRGGSPGAKLPSTADERIIL